MDNVKALFFDVGGTVFDWKNTVRDKIRVLAEEQGQTIEDEAFANDWRGAMFEVHAQVRQGDLPFINSDEMQMRALENMTVSYPLLGDIDHWSLVKSTWHQMKAFAGAAEGINRLRTKYTVVVLTILSWESIVASSKRANVQWDGILSCEFLGYYKPSLQAYRKGVSLLGLKPEQGMMVASHEGDLAAAQQTGMRTAHVKVPEEDLTTVFGAPVDTNFDIYADDYDALCKALQI